MPQPRSSTVSNLSIALACLAPASAAAVADLTFEMAPAPGGFVQACAGPSTYGTNLWPGEDHFLLYVPDTGANLVEESYVGDTVGDLTATFSGRGITNSSHAVAGLGFAHLSASNTAPDAAHFPQATAHGGWSETFVISNRALTGQPGFMQFTLNVHGTLYAAGFTGSSSFAVTGYKDADQLAVNPLFDPGASDPPLVNPQLQYGNWAIATFGNPPTENMTVNDTVTFAVPFTFGTPFTLGIYAQARAGMRSSGGAGGSSSAQTDFDNGVTWGGITNIYVGTTPTDEYTIASGSGIDWSVPRSGTEPADLDGSGTVDAADLAILLGGWGTSEGDVNGDGVTDATDLALLLGAWG